MLEIGRALLGSARFIYKPSGSAPTEPEPELERTL